MNSPLVLIQHRFPQEIVNIIQTYMTNDIVISAISEYFHYLFYEQDLYDDFVYSTYIAPVCYCRRLRRNKDCTPCYEYEYTYKYKKDSYITCIVNNDQFNKIFTHSING